MTAWNYLKLGVNKRKANIIARRKARGLDPKNAPAVDVATIKEIVIHCHDNDILVPESIRNLYLVKVLQLMIQKEAMSRTKFQRCAAKKLLGKPKGKLEAIDFNQFPAPDWMTRAYRNNRYVVMIEDGVAMSNGATAIKAMVQRHDDKPIPNHWREMQGIKNELFGPDAMGIEYYPPEQQLTDKANIYWLWIFPDGALPVAV